MILSSLKPKVCSNSQSAHIKTALMDYDVAENTHNSLHSLSGKSKRNVKLNFCELHTMACILSIQADIEFYQLDCSLGLSFKLLAKIFFMLFI